MRPTPNSSQNDVMENAKAYRAIKSRLLAMIGTHWPVGTKIPPIKQLAIELGAGQTNTHRAVKELVAEGLLASRVKQGTFVVDTVTNLDRTSGRTDLTSAPPVRQVAGTTVGILLAASALEGFMHDVVQAAEQIFANAGCRVERLLYENKAVRAGKLNQPDVDGFLVLNWNERDLLPVRPGQPIACLSTAASVHMLGAAGFDVVTADAEQGGFLVGEHLRTIGCATACFVGVSDEPGKYDLTSSLRLSGFEAGFGTRIPKSLQLFVGNYTTTEGAKIVQRYLQIPDQPRGIFCASDDIAIGFVHGALAHNVQAGKDYLLVGFDGQERGRNLSIGALTTAAIPASLMGRSAANFLITRLAYPDLPVRRLQLGCSLFVGATTRAV